MKIGAILKMLAITVVIVQSVSARALLGAFNLATGEGTGAGWVWDGAILTVNNGANVAVSGSAADGKRIAVANNATANITLHNVSITAIGDKQTPLLLNHGARLYLTLAGVNTLTGGGAAAGIQTTGARLTIGGTGSLTASGGHDAAGIGGSAGNSGGDITINGGTVTATGGDGAAGIGGGRDRAGGAVTITGGLVTAIGGDGAAGIGAGQSAAHVWKGTAGSLNMDGNAIAIVCKLINNTAAGATNTRGVKRGILFVGNGGTVYGKVLLLNNFTLAANKILTVPAGASLTVPDGFTLDNHGRVVAAGGVISVNGTLDGNEVSSPQAAVAATAPAYELRTPRAADLKFTVPRNRVYNGWPQGFGISVNGMGEITVFYEGMSGTVYEKSSTPPVNAGTYAVTADIAAGALYGAAEGIPLGSYAINRAGFSGMIPTIAVPGVQPGAPQTVTVPLADLTPMFPPGMVWGPPANINYAFERAYAARRDKYIDVVKASESADLELTTIAMVSGAGSQTVPVVITSQNFRPITVRIIVRPAAE